MGFQREMGALEGWQQGKGEGAGTYVQVAPCHHPAHPPLSPHLGKHRDQNTSFLAISCSEAQLLLISSQATLLMVAAQCQTQYGSQCR